MPMEILLFLKIIILLVIMVFILIFNILAKNRGGVIYLTGGVSNLLI